MNKTKDFEWIEIKSSENDYNNFVIVRYDWPCNIQRITEVVSQFREEKTICIIGAPRKEYINWWEDDRENDKYLAFNATDEMIKNPELFAKALRRLIAESEKS
jgi:hypothetical protein